MAEIDLNKFLEELLNSKRVRESVTFSSRTYGDEPLIQTGKQMRERMARNQGRVDRAVPHSEEASASPGRVRAQGAQPAAETAQPAAEAAQPIPPLPERYVELRRMSEEWGHAGRSSSRGALAYGTRAANRLFYEQARLMEDFEDDFEFHGSYFQYFPTYSSMTLTQLRGYFSWRTAVRAGRMFDAPPSFAFLHVYELLCGIGTTAGEQGFRDLEAFRDAYQEMPSAHGTTFGSYLRRWMRDYVAYHGLDPALLSSGVGGVQQHVLTLLQAEEACLRAQGASRKAPALGEMAAPSADELLQALDECSSYRITGARLYKRNPDDVRFVAEKVFSSLVTHCSRRRKTDFVEGLFGSPFWEPYTIFSSAVFYEPQPHPDASVSLSPVEQLVCKDGRWRRQMLCEVSQRSPELGAIMHAVDARLRDRLGYEYPLKQRKVAAYVTKFIDKAIDELLALKDEERRRREEEERRRITIDLSRLAEIRAAAAITQEALLTDEERGDPDGEKGVMGTGAARGVVPAEGMAPGDVAPGETGDLSVALSARAPEPGAEPALTNAQVSRGGVAHAEVVAPSRAPSASAIALTPAESLVVGALLAGEAPPAMPEGQMLSLVVDSLNEKLFDEVGDTVIEYDSDVPMLVEDYLDDVRALVGS